MKTILLVDDSATILLSISNILGKAGYGVEKAANAAEGLAKFSGSTKIDLLITDLNMPGMNGIEATRTIKMLLPDVKVLILTVHKTDEYIHESLKAGADGYILKDATHDELSVAIHSILNGKTYLSPDISERVVNGYLHPDGVTNIASTWNTLTIREREVLKLVAEGHPNKYIAEYLSLSVKTVEKHRSNLMKKLDLHNASTLTAYAIEKGLVNMNI